MSHDIKREMIGISLCVTGLTLMVLGFFVVVDNLNLPVTCPPILVPVPELVEI